MLAPSYGGQIINLFGKLPWPFQFRSPVMESKPEPSQCPSWTTPAPASPRCRGNC